MKALVESKLMLSEEQPPITAALYEYLIAWNGVFMRAKRSGLEACVPVAVTTGRPLIGLYPAEPFVRVDAPKVPAYLGSFILEQSRQAKRLNGGYVEALFHLWWDGAQWRCEMPAQEATSVSVKPTEAGAGSTYERALIEVHSHHTMPAYFSGVDNADELGFRMYGVIGDIDRAPKLVLRVGVHGFYWNVPASDFFDLPEEISRPVEDAETISAHVMIVPASERVEEAGRDDSDQHGLFAGQAGPRQANNPFAALAGWVWGNRRLAGAARRPAGPPDG